MRDRLSFRRFCGLPLEAETPDHASIWRFRQTIEGLGLSGLCWRRRTGSSTRWGSWSNAGRWWTRRRWRLPSSVRGGVNPRDPDARVAVKRKTVHFGTRAYLAVDEERGLCGRPG